VKKTILVTAIAAVMAGPAAALEADFYGNMRASYRTATVHTTGGTQEAGIDSSKLVVGWKGSEDLDNGNTVSFKLELEHDDTDTKNGDWDNDRSWVAIGGDWGKVVLGREDTFDGWANAGTDIFAINGGHGYFAGNELEHGIQYRGGTGAIKFGIGAEIDSEPVGGATNTTYGISFEGENWQVGAHGADADVNSATGIADAITPGETALNIGGYYTFGNFTIGVTLGDNGAAVNSEALDIVLAFPLGPCGALVGMASGDALDAAATGPSGDILNLGYNCSSGAAYYGLEMNDEDDLPDANFIAYYGVRF